MVHAKTVLVRPPASEHPNQTTIMKLTAFALLALTTLAVSSCNKEITKPNCAKCIASKRVHCFFAVFNWAL